MKSKKLFVCQTYYHTLITLIKALVNNECYYVFLADDIPNYKKLRENLENIECLKIIEFRQSEMNKNRKHYNNRFISIIKRKKDYSDLISKYCDVKLNEYELYLYNDNTDIGIYCSQERIQYHLIEDALDYFKYFDKYLNIKKNSYSKGTFKFYVKEKTGFGNRVFGSAPCCLDIEVNDLQGIKISEDKVFELPRKVLFDKLTEKQKELVYNTYVDNRELIDEIKLNQVLLCTQPLYKDMHVDTMDDQLKVFRSVVKKYTDEGNYVIIKPHPRDEADYSKIISEFDCGYIDKNLPSEILNYNPKAQYKAAISITSTSINFLECADDKVFMGRNYIAEVLGNGSFS